MESKSERRCRSCFVRCPTGPRRPHILDTFTALISVTPTCLPERGSALRVPARRRGGPPWLSAPTPRGPNRRTSGGNGLLGDGGACRLRLSAADAVHAAPDPTHPHGARRLPDLACGWGAAFPAFQTRHAGTRLGPSLAVFAGMRVCTQRLPSRMRRRRWRWPLAQRCAAAAPPAGAMGAAPRARRG
jgi:hypothetical protein